jgi:hypothetical protein
MDVAGEMAVRAAPDPVALAKSLQTPGPAVEAIMREFCTVAAAVFTNFTL